MLWKATFYVVKGDTLHGERSPFCEWGIVIRGLYAQPLCCDAGRFGHIP